MTVPNQPPRLDPGPLPNSSYRYLGNYCATGKWATVELSCDTCRVVWIGCWNQKTCPQCGSQDAWDKLLERRERAILPRGKVSNQHPKLDPGPTRIAIIGQSPGKREVEAGKPFVGPSGELLDSLLGHVGVSREMVFIGNVAQVRPPGGDFNAFAWEGEEVQEGIAQLETDLKFYQPTMILALGNEALHLLKHGNVAPGRRKEKGGFVHVWPSSISSWRGSLFLSSWLEGVKCLATYHPAAVLREPDLQPYVKVDARRMAQEAASGPALELPYREVQEYVLFSEALTALRDARACSDLVSIDTEGWTSGVTVFGWSFDPALARVIPFLTPSGESAFTLDEEVALWEEIKEWMEEPTLPKVLQNYLSDAFILAWTYGITLQGLAHDTMLLAWEAECELEKGLATLASLYTREPFWKSAQNYKERLAWVCGMDAMLTLEVVQVLERRLHVASDRPTEEGMFSWLRDPWDHYRFNMALLPSLLYMSLRGMRFDREKAKGLREGMQREIYSLQAAIDEAAGRGLELEKVLPLAVAAFGRKNPRVSGVAREAGWRAYSWNGKRWVKRGKWLKELPPGGRATQTELAPVKKSVAYDYEAREVKVSLPVPLDSWEALEKYCKPSCRESLARVQDLVAALVDLPQSHEANVWRGELATLLGTAVNVNSTGKGGDSQWLLYECWGLEKKFQKGAPLSSEDRAGFLSENEGEALTSDDEALLSLYLKSQDERLKLVLRMRKLVKEMSYLATATDGDGRVRTGLNLVATPTGRMASYKSPTGTSRLNLQTISKRLRTLFPADEGCVMMQRDLSGADGWTVAAHCAALGDPAMIEDFRARLKPQSILALLYKLGPGVGELSREELKPLIAEHVDEGSWQYMAFKRVFHLSNYAGAAKRMSESILSDAWKKGEELIYVPPSTCEDMQTKAFHVRYVGVAKWHLWWAERLLQGKPLETSFGHRHVFQGRKKQWGKRSRVWEVYPDTHRMALATEPQLNTTHALKRALFRLWYDPENRVVTQCEGWGVKQWGLRVEPLIPVHDSLLTQAREEDAPFMEEKMAEWFQNPLRIAGTLVEIPASSQVGQDWGMGE